MNRTRLLRPLWTSAYSHSAQKYFFVPEILFFYGTRWKQQIIFLMVTGLGIWSVFLKLSINCLSYQHPWLRWKARLRGFEDAIPGASTWECSGLFLLVYKHHFGWISRNPVLDHTTQHSTEMKSILALLALVALVGYVHSQLILDEDNPHDRKILDKIVAKINEAEHKHYKLKNVIYTLGDGPKFTLYLNVLDTDGVSICGSMFTFYPMSNIWPFRSSLPYRAPWPSFESRTTTTAPAPCTAIFTNFVTTTIWPTK